MEVKNINVKKLHNLVLLGFIATFLLLSSCSPALATKPETITFVEGLSEVTVIDTRFAGVNRIVEMERTGPITGDITGDFTAQCKYVYHNEKSGIMKMATVQVDYQIDGTYVDESGTLFSGTLFLQFNFKIIPEDPTAPTYTGNWAITRGLGDLANLHGQGIFTMVHNPGESSIRLFDGQVHFDPK